MTYSDKEKLSELPCNLRVQPLILEIRKQHVTNTNHFVITCNSHILLSKVNFYTVSSLSSRAHRFGK